MSASKFKFKHLGFSLLLIGCVFSGCTSKEESDSKAPAVSKQDWEEAVPVLAPVAPVQPAPTEQTAAKIATPAASIAPAPIKIPPEPEAVDGLQPYIQAGPKLLEQTIVQDLLKQAKGKVQVIEFFNYPCRWCAYIDPNLQDWLKTKPEDVIFMRVPVLFHANWSIFCKIYYAIERLAAERGIPNTAPIHAAFFEKVSQNTDIGQDMPAIYGFFVEQGLAKPNAQAPFEELLNKLEDNSDLFFAYRIKAIPTFVVQGKKGIYSTNINKAGGSAENVFKVIDYLTAINR